ncbi:class I SAM-dependent methyltransferase [uncultured Draconibacterium sp.]|uniref:class I SAM-dependent methyltransferase n=1 Tax=uncultured Draconibacterium sp. TaxID=1573823 RepID=UPI0032605DDB
MKNKKIKASYSYLAQEYYDESLHPTCANFRIASKGLIENILKSIDNNLNKRFLEVGAGKSVLLELIEELNIPSNKIIITDKDSEMLQYSSMLSLDKKYQLLCIDAEKTEFEPNSFDIIVSSLGDPYNTGEFWKEISRILVTNGICIFTTPSYEWSSRFRKPNEIHDFAEFITKDKKTVLVPSYIYKSDKQKELIQQNQLKVISTSCYELNKINSSTISHKLKLTNDRLPVVTSYLIIKE